MEIGRSKFYSQANASTIFNGLFHAYKGFFQVRSIDMCVYTYICDGYIHIYVCVYNGLFHAYKGFQARRRRVGVCD